MIVSKAKYYLIHAGLVEKRYNTVTRETWWEVLITGYGNGVLIRGKSETKLKENIKKWQAEDKWRLKTPGL